MAALRRFAMVGLVLARWACAQPVPLIFDTDMGNDIDDALALAMIHALESRGEAKLLAVTLTKDNRFAPAYVALVNRFYGRPDIPVGHVVHGKTPQDAAMIREPVQRAGLDPASLPSPEAVDLIRRTLAAQPDGAVVIVQVGFSTNLARLIATGEGRALAARKVRLLCAMAGAFPTGKPEYNVRIDLEAAQRVFSDWPTPVVASGYEIGESILYPAVSIERDFAYAPEHPIVQAYRAYQKMPYDRPTWDLTAVLYAVRPDRGYFTLSAPGRILVADTGVTTFETGAGAHRYLIVDDRQRARILEALTILASQPPGGRN